METWLQSLDTAVRQAIDASTFSMQATNTTSQSVKFDRAIDIEASSGVPPWIGDYVSLAASPAFPKGQMFELVATDENEAVVQRMAPSAVGEPDTHEQHVDSISAPSFLLSTTDVASQSSSDDGGRGYGHDWYSYLAKRASTQATEFSPTTVAVPSAGPRDLLGFDEMIEKLHTLESHTVAHSNAISALEDNAPEQEQRIQWVETQMQVIEAQMQATSRHSSGDKLMADYNQSSLNDRFDKLAKETLESLKSYIEQVFSRQMEVLMDGLSDSVRSCDAALRHDFNILQASPDASCH